METISIILQAGGRSSRMGTDKALIPFHGTTMLGYIYNQVQHLSEDIAIIANEPESYMPFDLPVYGDIYRDWGALGGLHAAIHYATRERCIVLACDMPFVNQDVLMFLLELSEDHDAVIPRLGSRGFTEPFRAVYRKTCLPHIELAIRNQKRRVNSFFDSVQVRYVDQKEIEVFDPALETFFNVNTPEDLETARKMAAGPSGTIPLE